MTTRLVFLLCMLVATAVAEPNAKAHYERGLALVAEKNFADAFDAFAAGYEASKRPVFLFNMGECARALGDVARARVQYERYLVESPSGELAGAARSRLAELPSTKPIATIPVPAKAVETIRIVERPVFVTTTRDVRIYERPVFWIGIGVALAAGTVAIYAATRDGGSMTCTQPSCIDLR